MDDGVALWLDEQGLMLMNPELPEPLRLTQKLLERRLKGGSLLKRAVGKKQPQGTLLDAFSGFGLDSLTLAHLGWEVTSIERDRLIWLMQQEFSLRAGIDMKSLCVDSLVFMSGQEQCWDVVYLDPMFSKRRKQALPNLALQHLQHLATPDSKADELDLEACLTLAEGCARDRIVLKRRLKDRVVNQPSHQLKGQAVRFDIYL